MLGSEGYALLILEELEQPIRNQLEELIEVAQAERERLATDEKRKVIRSLESGDTTLYASLTRGRPLQRDPVDQYRYTSRSRQAQASAEFSILGAVRSPLGLGGEYWIVDGSGKKRFVSYDDSVEIYLDGKKLSPEARSLAFRYLAVKAAENDRRDKVLLVYGALPQPPDSVDGVDLLLPMENLDPARIVKYLTFRVTPYNAVGDVVEDRITGMTSKLVRATGPIPPGAFRELVSEHVWYNQTIVCVEIVEVVVEYIEGGAHRLDLEEVLSDSFSNDCAYSSD